MRYSQQFVVVCLRLPSQSWTPSFLAGARQNYLIENHFDQHVEITFLPVLNVLSKALLHRATLRLSGLIFILSPASEYGLTRD